MPTVLHITNRPTPYRLPFFREAHRQLRARGDTLHVLFLGRGGVERLWQISDQEMSGFDHMTLQGERSEAREIIEAIDRIGPAVVVLAWAMDLTALRALLACRSRGIPCTVVCGESPWSARAGTWRALRTAFRRFFFRRATGFISYGESSTAYLQACGLSPEKIATGLNCVDTDYFHRSVQRHRSVGTRPVDADSIPLPEGAFACHVLFVGYLLSVKGVAETLKALALLDRPDIALHIVGEGPERESIEYQAQELGLARQVFLHGYRQTDELPRYYAFADVLVFPSLWEVYGLVMVEGAAASLPIVASRFAGGTADVVRDGENGFIVDPKNPHELADAIRILADDADLRRRMAEASAAFARERLTLSESVRRYVDALARFVSYIGIDVVQGPLPLDEALEEEREIERSGVFNDAGT